MLGGGDFRKILSETDPRLVLDMNGSLKRVPAGFPADTPDSDFYRVKVFCLYFAPDDKFFTISVHTSMPILPRNLTASHPN